ncbi:MULTISPECIES: thiolase family protein [unclassified Cryobacterium]|uniref:thiolase family protein n=1 Tax=unclassified Cryobacterium TaxID=2649013 RepID=UPI00106C1CA1|nr:MULTISPECIES: thiolase family protein [unclassified Cryobacterium]TFD02980.1 thiolase family protein [Cryobacterium sp. TMT1-66-1]TFD15335.1 thiolase family protein [Cryobacterium sp. TMT1-2-2]
MINVGIAGFGQSHFVTKRTDVTFPELVKEGADRTLEDAGIGIEDVDAVVYPLAPDALIGVNNGERWVIDALGVTGKPFIRVNNGGATGMSAVLAAWTHIASGMFDVILVAGADRVSESGSAQSVLNKMWDVGYERTVPLNTITMLALSAQRYMSKYNSTELDMARVAVKNRTHAALNPHAHLRQPITVDEVLASRTLAWPIKLGDACPASTGAAGVVLVSERYAKAHGLKPAWIRGIGQNTETFWMGDRVGSSAVGDHADADSLAVAFQIAYAQAGVTDPKTQIDVAEMYAPFSSVELHVIEAAGFAAKGQAPAALADGKFALGSDGVIVNPSGGTLCTNPIAVTGTIRVGEAANQVRGRAGGHQVPNARVAVVSAIGGDHQFYSTMVLSTDLEEI